MNDTKQTRQRMLALALPLTAALYICAEGVNPKGTDQMITTTAVAFKVLPIAAPFAVAMVLLAIWIWRAAESAAPVSDDREPTLVTV